MLIILIAAMAKNRAIGYQNQIPWQIKGEQKLFKEHTMGHTVIMGLQSILCIINTTSKLVNGNIYAFKSTSDAGFIWYIKRIIII